MKTNFTNDWSAGDLNYGDTTKPFWVCKNLVHNGYSFAKELYINKVIVTKSDGTIRELQHSQFTSFGVDDILDTNGAVKEEYENIFEYGERKDGDLLNVTRKKEGEKTSRSVYIQRYNFDDYGVSGTVVGYISKTLPTEKPIIVFTTLSFGPYGKNPPHEFSGGLEASRMMPSIWFATEDESITSIRFDYRFHLHTDDNSGIKLPLIDKEVNVPKPTVQNFASIIRDDDHLVVFSCFKKLLEAIDGFLKNQALLALQYDNLLKLWSEVFVLLRYDKLGDLIVAIKSIRETITELISLVDTIVYEMFFGIEICLATDLLKTFAVAIAVLKKEGDRLKEALMPVLQNLLGIVVSIFELISTISEDALDEAGTIFKELVIPPLAPIFRKKRIQRQQATRQTVKDLLIKFNDFKEAFKADLKGLFYQAVFTAGKIFTLIAFEAAEKPVEYEMVGNFVKGGQVDDTWDNLHWWGTDFLPTAPGAFHAIHQHFRWARYLGNPSPSETLGNLLLFYFLGGGSKPELDPQKTAPFRSVIEAFRDSDIGGPLIDPKIPNQTIQFAVALNGSKLDQSLLSIAKEKSFVEVAQSLSSAEETAKRLPDEGNQDRYTGSDIVYWLSLKATREDFKKPFRGTLMINGFYFAHERELPFRFLGDERTNFAAITKGTSAHRPAYSNPVKLFREPK